MKLFKFFLLLFLIFSLTHALGEQIISAEHITNGEEIYLGKIARGQTFNIYIDPIVNTGGKFGRGGRYDLAYAKNLPEGWDTKQSSLYGNPLEVWFRVSKDAEIGENKFLIFVKDEGNQEGLGIKWFVAKIDVVSDSSDASMYVNPIYVGVRNPVDIYVKITNKVDFGNIYNVKVSSKDYMETTSVYVPPHSSRSLVFSTNFNKEGKEKIKVFVEESGNKDKHFEFVKYVEVQENLLSEYNSIGEGIMLVPISQALPYYLSYLISTLFR